MRTALLPLGTFLLFALGCHHDGPAVDPAAVAKVRLMKNDPPAECREVSDVQATASEDDVKSELKQEAVKVGANYVRMETEEFATFCRYLLKGTAYACPDAASSAAAPPAAAAPAPPASSPTP